MPENFLVYGLIEKYSGIFVNGMGGISADGIRLILDECGITDSLDIIEKIVCFLTKAHEVQRTTNGT